MSRPPRSSGPVPATPRHGWRWASCALALSLGWPAMALAAEPVVHIEAKIGDNLPPDLDVAVVRAATKGAAAAQVEVSEDAPARLEVTVSWSDDRELHYSGAIVILEGNQELRRRTFSCEVCGTSDLLARVESEVPLALGGVTWPESMPEPETQPPVGPAPGQGPGEGGGAKTDDGPKQGPNMKLIGAGAAVGGLGVVSVVVGAVFMTREDVLETMPESAEGPVWAKSFRPPGIGLLAGGAGAIVIGTALVVVGATKKKGGSNKVAVAPAMGRGFAGLSLGGRF